MKLDPSSSTLCIFNTPFGRYMCICLPFGLSSSQYIFQKLMPKMFKDIEGNEVIVNDLLVWGENGKQHDCRLMQILNKARQ